MPNCELCGEPMPPGEEMFTYHGYSGPCPKPPLPKAESGWVIVRYNNSEIRYWIGQSAGDESFLPDSLRAIRFARQVDAAYVLAWLLHGHGRAEEHMWV